MNRLTKIFVSVISVLIIALVGILLYVYWPAITGTIADNKYYTSEDLQSSYDNGFKDGNKSQTELTAQVEYYRTLVDEYYSEVEILNQEIEKLNTDNINNLSSIKLLKEQKLDLENQVANLTEIKTNNEELISSLNSQVSTLQKEVANLTLSGQDKDEVISQKNAQISNLQTTITQLQITNELNNQTIINLNAQIVSLNSQITEMTEQVQNNSNVVSSLNTKISELEKSVAYYEQYIANLEKGEQVVATFEFNGSVCNIQIVDKNSTVSITNPAGTEHVIFNYWTVNGEQVDLSTYQITTNTKFVANVTHKYDVKFKVDNTDYDSQIVVENGFATLPEEPTKVGYEFDGWSLNGVDIVENIPSTVVTQNVTYQAVFTKIHTVTFMYEDEVVSTQSVRNGEFAKNVEVENTDYKVFNGWAYNDTLISIDSYKVYTDITFVADITYKFNVVFTVEGNEYDSQIVVENGFATLPANPTKEGYDFVGWSLNGVEIVENISSTAVSKNIIYQAVFISNTWETVTWSGDFPYPDINDMFTDGVNFYLEYKSQIYLLNLETFTSEKVTFTNLPENFSARSVWSDGENTYYSCDGKHYILDVKTLTWEEIGISGLNYIDNFYIWSDGENTYYSQTSHFVFNKENLVWEEMIWNGFTDFDGMQIWSDGENVYYSINSDQFKLNIETKTWEAVTWNMSVQGEFIHSFGNNVYCFFGNDKYVLNRDTMAWEEKSFYGIEGIQGNFVWSDGENLYYSYYSLQYKLDSSLFVGNSVAWADYMGAYIYDYSPSGFGSEGDELGSVLGFVPNAYAVILDEEELIITLACYDEGSDSIIYAGETYLESGLVESWIVEDFDNGKFILSFKLDEELIDAERFYVDNSQLMYDVVALQKVSSATEAA